MKAPLFLALFLTTFPAYGILPLPYPTEAVLTDESAAQQENIGGKIAYGGFEELFSRSQLREMELPTFGAQTDAVGYVPGDTFVVPPGLKPRVEFWKKIYAEYTSQQAVLHDSENLDIVYDVLDVSSFLDPREDHRQARRRLSRYLKEEKDKISAKLLELHAIKDEPLKVPMELFPLYRKFQADKDPDRFLKASKLVRSQTGQRDRIVRGFLFGGRYFARMMGIFEKMKVPKELTRLPLVESAFNLAARSKVGASGVWQFMRYTGKRYLRIDRAVDERNDPIAASWAAAELLRGNYEALGSWPLAITAYNHGREGMARAARELGTKDLPTIIRRYKAKSFGFASSNFYSEFLAILEVERDYRKFFGPLLVDKPIEFEEFRVDDNVRFDDLAGACGAREEELAVLNPSLTDWVFSGKGVVPQGFMLKVPMGRAERCRSGYRNVTKVSWDWYSPQDVRRN